MTLCPARGSHLGSGLYQQLMKSLSEGFISECMGTILNRIPRLPRSPRCIVLSMPNTTNQARHSLHSTKSYIFLKKRWMRDCLYGVELSLESPRAKERFIHLFINSGGVFTAVSRKACRPEVYRRTRQCRKVCWEVIYLLLFAQVHAASSQWKNKLCGLYILPRDLPSSTTHNRLRHCRARFDGAVGQPFYMSTQNEIKRLLQDQGYPG